MKSELPNEHDEDLVELRRHAEMRRPGYGNLLGLLIGPLFLIVTWIVTHDQKSIHRIDTWIFCVSAVTLVIAFLIYSNKQKKLKHLYQEYSIQQPQIFGAKNGSHVYQTDWYFERFTKEDFQTYKQMRLWGNICIFSILVLFGWFFFGLFINNFILK